MPQPLRLASAWRDIAAFTLFLMGIYLSYIGAFHGYDLSKFPGDRIDSRFELITLEHNYQYWRRETKELLTAPFFFPMRESLLLSDSHIVISLPYILLRLLGLDKDISFSLWIIIGILTKYAACYIILRRYNINPFLSAAGSFIFAISAPVVALRHPKTVWLFPLPFIFYHAQKLLERGNVFHFRKVLLWLSIQNFVFLQGGMMSTLSIFVFLFTGILIYRENFASIFRSSLSVGNIPYLLFFIISLLYMFAHNKYSYPRPPVSGNYLSYLVPSLWSLFYHPVYDKCASFIGQEPYIKAYQIGFISSIIGILSIFLSRTYKHRFFIHYAFSLLIIIILTTRPIDDLESPVEFLLSFLHLNKVQGLYRFFLIELFMVVLLFSLSINYLDKNIVNYMTILFCLSSFSENLVRRDLLSKLDKVGYRKDIECMKNTVANKLSKQNRYKSFVLVFDDRVPVLSVKSLELIVLGMYVAQELQVPIVNGYSTFCPPGGMCYEVRDTSIAISFLKYHGMTELGARDSVLYLRVDDIQQCMGY